MNVVPLVDVVLVLLIIFMVTAHAIDSGLNIEAPQVKQVVDTTEDSPQVSMTRDAKLFLNGQPVKNINTLGADINKRFNNPKMVFLMGDRRLVLQDFMNVVSALSEAKLQVKVITTPMDLGKKP